MPSSIESPVVYVQLSGRYLRGNVQLLNDSELIRQSKTDSIIDGVYFGILALFIFFNLIIYKVFNRVSHLSYSLLLTVTFIWIASGQGWISFFNEQLTTVPVFTPNSLGILFSFAIALFSRQFLQMKVINPKINKVLYYNQLLAIAFWFLYIVTYQSLPHFIFQLGYVLCSINTLVILLGSILGAIAGIYRGRNNAKLYLLAMIVLISVAISMSLSASGLVNISFSWRTFQLASVLEVIILSIGFVVEHYQKHRELEEIEHKIKDLESELKTYKIDTNSLKSNISDNLVDSQLIPVLAKVLPILPHLLWVKADGNYCVASYKNENSTDEQFIDCNLQLLLDSIGDEKLLRCHKSYLVNLSQPYQLTRRTSADYDLVIGEHRVPIGRKYLSMVRKAFKSSEQY
nr:7TM diverse intracellular signaling domain-containing protein [Shewanella electrodiphila]